MDPDAPKVGHGDHWYAALDPGDPRMMDALAIPLDAPEGVALTRSPLTDALDMVQVTAKRRLVTAYPEPRATALLMLRPRELALWETRVEGWMVADHAGAGALTFFLTDLVENATRYQKAHGEIALEVGALAYTIQRAPATAGASRLRPAREKDARFLPDDFWFEADVLAVKKVAEETVLDLAFQGGLELPVASRGDPKLQAGDRAVGYAWLTARLPEGN